MVDPTGYVLDYIVSRLERRAVASAGKIRDLQARTGRTDEQVVRFSVFANDVTLRTVIEQRERSYTRRIRADGLLERVPDGTPANSVVRTDVPTIIGICRGKMTYLDAHGNSVVHQPFTFSDAVRLRHLEWEGSGALRNLALLEQEVFPMLSAELGLAWRDLDSASRAAGG